MIHVMTKTPESRTTTGTREAAINNARSVPVGGTACGHPTVRTWTTVECGVSYWVIHGLMSGRPVSVKSLVFRVAKRDALADNAVAAIIASAIPIGCPSFSR